MWKRQYLTPPEVPEDIYCRQLQIPNSPEWIGTLTGALYPLCFPEAWTQEAGGISPELAAERFTVIFDTMFYGSGGCEDMACCPMRVNPYNGRLQQSSDGGLTWLDVDDGPWVESLYPAFSGTPPPRPEATEDEKRCAAAATAAYVLTNLYTQTGNTLLNVVAATDWEYAGALGSMLSGFLLTIGAVATQPYVALATLLGIVGVRQQYLDYPLDGDDEDALKCILLENASVQPDGSVTFDFQATWDAIDLDSPKNGLVRFLLTMIGPDALNYGGGVQAGLSPDCSDCGCSGSIDQALAVSSSNGTGRNFGEVCEGQIVRFSWSGSWQFSNSPTRRNDGQYSQTNTGGAYNIYAPTMYYRIGGVSQGAVHPVNDGRNPAGYSFDVEMLASGQLNVWMSDGNYSGNSGSITVTVLTLP